MKKIGIFTVVLLLPSLLPAFTSSQVHDEDVNTIKNTVFAKNQKKCSIFSYTNKNRDKETALAFTDKSAAFFNQDDFNNWKKACDAAANQWVYNFKNSEEIKEYEICKNLTSELTLSLAIIGQEYSSFRDLAANMQRIRDILDPVAQAAKRMKGSVFKRVKGVFKKDTSGMDVINTIKDILEKRVKELFDDFNNKLKSSGRKDIKKISF